MDEGYFVPASYYINITRGSSSAAPASSSY
jgi:hypothetical protein